MAFIPAAHPIIGQIRVTARRVVQAVTPQKAAGILAAIFSQVQLLALPTVRFFRPPLDGAARHYHDCTLPFNLAGVPALALPVPAHSRLPASLQLVGPPGSEEVLLATGAIVEAAAA